jgi:Tol biopolymer transport system component
MMKEISSSTIKIAILVILLCSANVVVSFSQQNALGQFEGQTTIGRVKSAGSTYYNPQPQDYLISGGVNESGNHKNAVHFVWKKMNGDFILRSRAHFSDKKQVSGRKFGWMIRSSLDSASLFVAAAVNSSGESELRYKPAKNASIKEIQPNVNKSDVIQLERKGNVFIMSVAHFGEPFKSVRISNIGLGKQVYVGLFVDSQDRSEKVRFENVRIVIPAGKSLVPYHNFLGSNLEIMNVKTGHRKIIYRENASLQAPNWTPGGKTLIYNKNGHLYRFNLATDEPTLMNTGFADHINNDHVLSFGGKLLGISNTAKNGKGKSNIYILPAAGGTPRRITSKGPSYLHGWSPDNKWLVYPGKRNGNFDIYKISVNGGKEIRLTRAKGLDDGSEYTPDGKWIYFNSVRSGTMQIWRMKPDGSDQERVTHDQFNDWFPHISPDGKWIEFLSYTQKVPSGEHPFYKHVYLQLMPVSGGKSKIIAYLYGGQGTINVPSWSPDSKRIAFISNTGM